MKKNLWLACLVSVFACATVSAQEVKPGPEKAKHRIAVAEPEAKGGISAEDVAGISNYLETRIGGNYEVFSRAALRSILREKDFNESGMVLPDEATKELAQKSVHYLLTYSISRIGEKRSMFLAVVDPSTGKIRDNQRESITGDNLDQLFAKIDVALSKMGILAPRAGDEVKILAVLPVVSKQAPALADEYYKKLLSYLSKSGGIQLVSRTDLEKIAQESAIAESAFSDPGQFSKIAQLKVADYLVLPEITRFELEEVSPGTAIAGAAVGKLRMKNQVSLRVVEVKSGKIIAQDNMDSFLESTDVPPEIRRTWNKNDYTLASLDLAANRACEYLLERLDPVLVAAVVNGEVYLTRGEGAGVKVGDVFQIFNPGKEIVHPRTGKVLGTAETLGAEIRITTVVPDMSVATIVSGGDMIRTGAVCRRKKGAPRPGDRPASASPPPAPAYPIAR